MKRCVHELNTPVGNTNKQASTSIMVALLHQQFDEHVADINSQKSALSAFALTDLVPR